ncbi:MAG: flagellar basal body P-ring formation chaperone FlgA [Gemmatimonadota bacterium]
MRRVAMAAAALAAALAAAAAPRALPAQDPSPPTVPVAARVIPRGRILSTDDIVEQPANPGGRPLARRPAAGWVARRLIAVGEPLREPSVTPPMNLMPGDSVDAVRTTGGLTLALRATALQGAAIGDQVAVRVDAKRRFVGTLAGPRLVVLP